MIQGIAHSAVTVKDMDESIRFYTRALGFRQAFELRRPETDEASFPHFEGTRIACT